MKTKYNIGVVFRNMYNATTGLLHSLHLRVNLVMGEMCSV